MRDKWTDERLDDLKGSVESGFDRVDKQFDRVDQQFERVDRRFEHVETRMDGLQKTMTNGFIALFGTQVTLFAALAGLIVALH